MVVQIACKLPALLRLGPTTPNEWNIAGSFSNCESLLFLLSPAKYVRSSTEASSELDSLSELMLLFMSELLDSVIVEVEDLLFFDLQHLLHFISLGQNSQSIGYIHQMY